MLPISRCALRPSRLGSRCVPATPPCRGRPGGFAFIDVILYLTLLLIIGAPLVMIALSGYRSVGEGMRTSLVAERNRAISNRLTEELQGAISSTVSVLYEGRAIRFVPPSGFDGTGPIPGPAVRYEVRMDPAEQDNGIDDDNDGVVDERIIMRIEEANGSQTVVSGNVGAGTSFSVSDGVVDLTLVTVAGVTGGGPPIQITRTTRILARNE